MIPGTRTASCRRCCTDTPDWFWNAVSAFANCGRAVAHVRGSYVPSRTEVAASLDHLVGAADERGRKLDAEDLGGL